MKHLLFILLFIPSMLFSQVEGKYLTGAVPEIDGKVIFTQVINAPGLSQDQVFDTIHKWAQSRFVTNKEQKGRVLYTNKEKGEIACSGEEYITFTKTALSLDRSMTNYRITIVCSPGKCEMDVTSIRYSYNVSYQKEPEKYLAEEWITDKFALNGDQTKLARGTGKFRSKTIDLIDELFASAQTAFGNNATTAQTATAKESIPATKLTPATPVAQATTPAATLTPATPVATATAASPALQGYKQITPDKIPGNIIKMLTEDWMLITAGNDQQFNMMTAGWGGLGSMFGKPVAFCFIAPTRYTCQLMEKNDTYTLTFYTEAYRDALKLCGSKSGKEVDKVKATGLTPITTPSGSKAFSEAWLIIECRKTVSQSITPEAICNEKLKEEWAEKQLYKMFIGEIINVWVK